jgi:type IV secretion system protein VirB6
MEFFAPFFASLDSTLLEFVNSSVAGLSQYVTAAIRVFGIITLILIGIQGLWSPFQYSASKYFGTVFMVALIGNIATVPATYNAYLGDHLLALPDDLFIAIAATDSQGNTYTDTNSIGVFFDRSVSSVLDGVSKIWHLGGLTDIGPILIAAVLFVFLVWLGAAATVTILVAKIGISIMVAVGPLMILSLIHPITRDFFFKWLSYSLHFALLQLLIGAAVVLTHNVMSTYMEAIISDATPANEIIPMMAPAIAMMTLAYIFGQLPSMASSIMGGIGLNSGNMAWSGPIGTPRNIKAGYEMGKGLSLAIAERLGRMGGGGSVRKGDEGGGTVSRGDEPTRPHQPGGRE